MREVDEHRPRDEHDAAQPHAPAAFKIALTLHRRAVAGAVVGACVRRAVLHLCQLPLFHAGSDAGVVVINGARVGDVPVVALRRGMVSSLGRTWRSGARRMEQSKWYRWPYLDGHIEAALRQCIST